tara:strand:- start:629 stop:1246 length:618 start_codon:yes stop_codon:yes gene_type:complete
MATPFKDIANAAGNRHQDKSVQWYVRAVRNYARGINTFQEARQSDLGKEATQLEVGKMYLFSYDPKTKADLPYYDTVPLVVITEPLPGGFSGINLHYLAPTFRANLLDKIMPTDRSALTDKSVLRATWSFLKNFSRFPEARGSVKKYLTPHITGKMIEVDPENWKAAIFLPVQSFVGASDRTVYRNTMEKPERKRRMSISTSGTR